MKYWIEGEQKAIHTLFNAFTNNKGWASLDDIVSFFEESDKYESLFVHDINVV